MSRSERDGFQELLVWQKARHLTRAIYESSRDSALGRDLGLASQMQRAAVSIMANVAEGSERGPREFARFLSIAQGSCAELRSHLVVANDIGYLNTSGFETLDNMAVEIGRMLAGLRASVIRRIDSSNTSRESIDK
ncbi:MAG: four helix bundle protein [Chloroflexi bacterium]|nr:four helix bundle protein [Chloroflexota bacterium]